MPNAAFLEVGIELGPEVASESGTVTLIIMWHTLRINRWGGFLASACHGLLLLASYRSLFMC